MRGCRMCGGDPLAGAYTLTVHESGRRSGATAPARTRASTTASSSGAWARRGRGSPRGWSGCRCRTAASRGSGCARAHLSGMGAYVLPGSAPARPASRVARIQTTTRSCAAASSTPSTRRRPGGSVAARRRRPTRRRPTRRRKRTSRRRQTRPRGAPRDHTLRRDDSPLYPRGFPSRRCRDDPARLREVSYDETEPEEIHARAAWLRELAIDLERTWSGDGCPPSQHNILHENNPPRNRSARRIPDRRRCRVCPRRLLRFKYVTFKLHESS